MRVYSCYFSPNDPFEIFETQILLLEESLREASGRSLIAGDSRGLKMAPEKTEALLVTDRRSLQYPRIVLGEHEIECTWECSWIEGLASANTCRSRLQKQNVGPP